MKGLLKKELYLLFGIGRVMIVFTVVFAILAGLNMEVGGFASTFAFCYVPLGVFSVLSWEEKQRWASYILCTPVSRFQVVLAKYLLTLAHMLGVVVIYAVTAVVSGKSIHAEILINGLTLAFAIGAVSFPPMFYFGSDKARGVIVGLAMVISIMVGTFVGVYNETTGVGFMLDISPWVPAAAFVVFAATCPLSAWLYKKRK